MQGPIKRISAIPETTHETAPNQADQRLSDAKQPAADAGAAEGDEDSIDDAAIAKALSALDALSRTLESSIEEDEPAAPEPAALVQSEADASLTAPTETAEELQAMVAQLEREREELTETVRAAASREEQLRQACAERDQRIAALETELRDARAGRADGPPDAAAARLAQMEAKYMSLVTTYDKERRAHATEVGNLTRQLSQLRQRPEGQSPAAPTAAAAPAPAPAAAPPPQPPDTSTRPAQRMSAPLTAARFDAEPPPPQTTTMTMTQLPPIDKQDAIEPSGPPELFMIDDSEVGEEVSRNLSKFGVPFSTLPPNTDLAEHLADRNIGLVALNLAMPATWRVLRSLAQSDAVRKAPMVAYALPQRTSTGFWFGSIGFATLPIPDATLAETARRLAPGIRQVIAISSDGPVLATIRAQLTKVRIVSVAAADRRQALEVVRGVTPQAAVVYPSSSPVDAFRALAALRGNWTFKDIPTLILLDHSAPPREEELLSSGVRTILRLGNLNVDELTSLISTTMTGLRSPLRAGGRR